MTMAQQIPIDTKAGIGRDEQDGTHEIAADVAYQRLAIVNVVYEGRSAAPDRQWVLIDAGVAGTGSLIEGAAEARYGKGSRPAAIVLTHGHFDHVGALEHLAERWDVPIFAHELEHPYLDGRSSYPPPDPSVGGGLMAALSSFYWRG
jgi:glyoxylase-like metal-dependent hydrolase (beta-lactamase superfamily II)